MSNDKNIKYKNLEVPESSKDVISSAYIRVKTKILAITLSEEFENAEILHVFNTHDIDRGIKGLLKKVKQKVPEITDKELYQVEDLILRNASILEDNSNRTDMIEIQEQSTESRPEISFEGWQKKLQEKYQILRETTFKNFSDVWQAIEYTLSVKNILHIGGNTLPFAGVILGPPSSSKTLALEMLRELNMVFYTDSFTAKSFVSHITTVNNEELEKIDMLPRIKNKLFLTPELAPLFSARDEDLQNVLGIVTRILDGHGYESDSGACGHRGYIGDYMFTWVGASVEIPRKVYKLLGNLGPKLYFYRMVTNKKKEDDYLNELVYVDHKKSKQEVKDALLDYIKWFDRCPGMLSENGIVKIQCDHVDDNDTSLRYIVKIGMLLAQLRGVAQTWDTNGTQGSDYGFYSPIIEHPSRAITCLRNLALVHALIEGRGYITSSDISIVIKTALSTAPVDRVKIFDLLLNSDGILTSSTIMKGLGISRPTALKTMAELNVLGLVKLEDAYYQDRESQRTITLKNEFKWFLSSEFRELRGGFIPEKFEECKEKSPPPILKKYDDGEDFDFDCLKEIAWEEFKQLEAKESVYEKDYVVVEHTNLRNAILRNPDAEDRKITKEAADILIDKLLESGMLSRIREGWYYRTTKDNENNAAAVAAS